MCLRILRILLAATLLINAVGAPLAMADMIHDPGHPASHGARTAVTDATIRVHDTHYTHDMDHAQMPAGIHPPGDPTAANPEDAGACCDGTSCSCGCVLPPALVLAVLPQLPLFAALAPAAVLAEHSKALPSMPPFRPPSV